MTAPPRRIGKANQYWFDVACPERTCEAAGKPWRILAPRGESYTCSSCGALLRVLELARAVP